MESTLLADVEKQIAVLDKEYPEKEIDLVLDTTFTEQIQRLGELELKILDKETPTIGDAAEFPSKSLPPVKIPEDGSGSKVKECKQPPSSPRDFTQIKEPILSALKQGDGDGDLKYPQRVAIDPKTGNIFIAGQTSHCVKIFSQQGEYKDAVRYNGNQYRYELVHPFGVCFFQDSLYVTSLLEKSFGACPQPCIFRFDRVGGYEAKFRYSMSSGKRGSDEGQFNKPRTICADQANGDVYVCDDKKRIQVLDKNLNYKRLVPMPKGCEVTEIQVKGDRLYFLKSGNRSIFECSKQGRIEEVYKRKVSACGLMHIACFEWKISQIIPCSQAKHSLIACSVGMLFIGQTEHGRSDEGVVTQNFRSLNSINLRGNPADDGGFEVRGMCLDESSQRLILVLHSKDSMLQIF